MDPDQVAAAADATAYAGGCGRAGGDESLARALLRRGWDMSRKAAIASVAATAAPVLVPPVIILSIAGVALSVPFAACLASLAATDRLMGALLPPAAPQPYYTYDLGDEEPEQGFVDASEAPPDQEAPVSDHWSKAEEYTIMDQNERYGSLPPSRGPRLSEELVPLLGNEEGDSAEGEFAIQTSSGHDLFLPRDQKHNENNSTAMEVDSEYITMEAPSPGDVSVLEAPLLHEEDNISRTMEDAQVPTKESVQLLPGSENENKTADRTSPTTMEMSSKEMVSPGVNATELSNLWVSMFNEDNMILREGEGEVSIPIGHDSHVSDSGNKTGEHQTIEDMPQYEINVSESPVPVTSKLEHEPAEEMALQEQMRDTNTVTGDGADVQQDVNATAEPQSESLHSRLKLANKRPEVTESIHVYDTLGSYLTEGIVKDTSNKTAEGVEQFGKGGMPSVVPMDDEKDLIPSRIRPNVSSIHGGTTSVGSKLNADRPNQTTIVANKEDGKEEMVEDKHLKTEETKILDVNVPKTDIEAQDDHISKLQVPDYQSMRENEVTVEMVLEEVTSSINPVTGEVVEVQVDIIARESESRPITDLVDQDIQVVMEAGTFDHKMKDNMKVIKDTKLGDVDHQIGGGSSIVGTVTSALTVDDGEDQMSSGSTPYVSAISDDISSVEGRPDLENCHQIIGVEYRERELNTNVVAEGKDIYTEEQLREQLDTLRMITGYRGVPSLSPEGDLAALYIFVGVEPPRSSGDALSLTELNTKLRFLKSIIGVE